MASDGSGFGLSEIAESGFPKRFTFFLAMYQVTAWFDSCPKGDLRGILDVARQFLV